MAYTFDKIDDYFRKNKTGTTGSLQKGQTSAPAPTKAAQNLARAAETSPSGASAYRQQQGEDTSAISGRLLAPASQQMQNWGAQQDVAYSGAKAAGEKKISDTYTPFSASDIAGAEAGNEQETTKLSKQIGYTGTEIPQTPYEVTPLKMDTTSFLSSGVGGVQSGLQKKGGRYTPGMAALDASLFSANRGGVTGLQSKVGGMYEQSRQKQAELEGLDEYLAGKAKTTGTGIASQVRKEVGSRAKDLQKALRTRREGEISAGKQSERAGYIKDLQRQADEILAGNPAAVSEGFTYKTMPNFDVSRYITPTPTTETIAPTQDIINLANILGVTPESLGDYGVTTENYAVDPYGMQTDIDKAMTDYMTTRRPVPKMLPPIPAPESTIPAPESTIPVGEIIAPIGERETEFVPTATEAPLSPYASAIAQAGNEQVVNEPNISDYWSGYRQGEQEFGQPKAEQVAQEEQNWAAANEIEQAAQDNFVPAVSAPVSPISWNQVFGGDLIDQLIASINAGDVSSSYGQNQTETAPVTTDALGTVIETGWEPGESSGDWGSGTYEGTGGSISGPVGMESYQLTSPTPAYVPQAVPTASKQIELGSTSSPFFSGRRRW